MTDQTLIVILLATGAFCISVAVVLWGRGSSIASGLRFLQAEQYDPAKGSLPVEAIPMHLGPELVRSHWNGTPVVLLALRVTGLKRGNLGRIVRSTMRVDETCYDVDRSTVLVSLRGTSFSTLEPALRRFCLALQAAGGRGIDVGAAACPAHGSEVSQLVKLATTSMIPAEDVLVSGPNTLVNAVTRRPKVTGITLASFWFGLIWVAALGFLTSVSQFDSKFMPIGTAVGVSLALLAAGFVRDHRVPFPTWVRRSRRKLERESGVFRPRGELFSALAVSALMVGTAAGALAATGRDARLITDASIIVSAGVVGVLGGRFLGSIARWVAVAMAVAVGAGIAVWWNVANPGINDVASWTLAACVAGVCLGSVLALIIRRPMLVMGAILVAGVGSTVALELVDASARLLEIRSYVYIWTPGGVVRSGAGVVAAAAALGALIAACRMPLMRVALSCGIGAAIATVLRWIDGFNGTPASAIVALSALAILGPVLAGRTTRSLKSK
jgi:hypothetical protein